VKTRTLVLLALACGLAILLAGGIQLVRLALARDDTVEVLAVGEAAQVGGAQATVLSFSSGTNTTTVHVSLRADEGQILDASAGWAMLAGGRLAHQVEPPAGNEPCEGLTIAEGTSAECVLGFDAGDERATVSFSRDDQQQQWALTAPSAPDAQHDASN
jgi:hypothetical protein